ncbi:MAG TPA: GAF domain-containing protein [Ohtaekwangia sp.]|uniref:GAF domain-containing protein n=1 Tax=Ohtaekwangia sp. TaxID=2066019 RepID=UPI002F952188
MKNRALKYTIAFGAVGLIIAILISYVERSTVSTYQNNLPYISLGDNIKNRVTQAHLWFEELMAGDATLNYERDIQPLFVTSKEILQTAYEGKDNELGKFKRDIDEETRAILKESVISLDKLVETAQERWKLKQQERTIEPVRDSTGAIISSVASVGEEAGGALDQKFDANYDEFQKKMDQLISHVDVIVKADSSYINFLSWLSILLLIAAFALLCILLYRLQSSSDSMVQENNVRLEAQNKDVSSLTGFVEAISAGNYDVELQALADADLGTTLMTMRNKLRNNAEDDRRRNWSTTGLAQIGEILRTSTSSTEELFDNIIKFVVKYTRSNQGGLFVLNEENEGEKDKQLELVACYAFERKKFLKKKVAAGEGLVGQCYMEGERIYLLEVPQEYVSITSGLGGSNPNALLLVPLKVNEQIYGVIELATFGKYQEYEVDLVEKLAESIASTISTVRANESTRILLERTQQQAEEMRAQEEEMRQNMEELEATQEEMRRKEKHIQNMLDGEKHRNDISQRNRKVLMELTKNRDVQSGNWNAALEKITSTICNQLHVSRCSVWSINSLRNKLTNEKLYKQRDKVFESGMELVAKDYPGYFEALTGEDIIVANDALTHAATREFTDTYFNALDIRSLLDVPFFNEGRIAGVICCEHQHEQKAWTEEDIEFLKSCADLVTVAYNTMKINTMIDNLNDAQETLQTIIDNIPRAVFWKDKDLRFQGCNRIFANVAGLKSHKDLVGHTDFDMPWKEHAEAYRADDLAVMNSRKARLDLEEKNVNSNGDVSWVLTSKVPVMNQHGEVVAVLGMFEDITERKLKEADIESKLKELEQLRKMLESRTN